MNRNQILDRLHSTLLEDDQKTIRIMEVCGTHTQSISKSGIQYLLPENIKLLSGPGCPVCVTNESYIDMAIQLLLKENTILATFGDMLKVRGSKSSLSSYMQNNIYTVYSPEDAIQLAKQNPDKMVVFLAVGFETTAPLIAATIKNVFESSLDNLLFLTSLKRMEPVLRLILNEDKSRVDGLLLPGHVAAILGADAFRFVTDEFHIPAVVCGFETLDIVEAILLLLNQITGHNPVSFANGYERCVRSDGNKLAQDYIEEVFKLGNATWRGIGAINDSAFVIKEKYQELDAKRRFSLSENEIQGVSTCQCSDIILGIKTPCECIQFGKRCTSDHPLGPCMISSEGACAIHYRYGRFFNCTVK